MKIRIYQINGERDSEGAMFTGFPENDGKEDPAVDPSIYDRTYDGETGAATLEEVYAEFNTDLPEEYCGRSLSVSDVVEVTESDTVRPGFYFCDCIGFREIPFDSSLAYRHEGLKMTVVMVEPGKEARIAEIGTDLSDMQKAVNGYIEEFSPFDESENVCIVCNDEGKINGSLPNRAVYGDDGKIADVIFGTFFICDSGGPDFGSLSRSKQEKYLGMFRQPERIYRSGGEIKAEKYEPCRTAAER